MSLCLICQANELGSWSSWRSTSSSRPESRVCQVSHWPHCWRELICYTRVCGKAIKAFVLIRVLVRVGLDKQPHSNAHQMITQLSGYCILLAISWRKSSAQTGGIHMRFMTARTEPHTHTHTHTQEMSCLPTGDTFHILQHVAQAAYSFHN